MSQTGKRERALLVSFTRYISYTVQRTRFLNASLVEFSVSNPIEQLSGSNSAETLLVRLSNKENTVDTDAITTTFATTTLTTPKVLRPLLFIYLFGPVNNYSYTH